MSKMYKIKDRWIRDAKINKADYEKMYNESITENESFGLEKVKE